jgi:hypothetical protein
MIYPNKNRLIKHSAQMQAENGTAASSAFGTSIMKSGNKATGSKKGTMFSMGGKTVDFADQSSHDQVVVEKSTTHHKRISNASNLNKTST